MTTALHPSQLPTLTIRAEEAKRAPVRVDLALDRAECAALAALHGLEAVEGFVLKGTASTYEKRTLKVEGDLSAQVTYVCGVTLQPYTAALEVAFKQLFVPDFDHEAGEAIEIDPLDDFDVDQLHDGVADVADAAYQLFAISLDPFPRHPSLADGQARDSWTDDSPEDRETQSPFAVLSQLKPNA